jgi:hypothetical protein
MSNDEFAAAMRPLGTALSRWATAWASQPDRHTFLPAAGSLAMAELAAEERWATTDWLEPCRNAHSYGHMLAYALAEHLAALSAIVLHSQVGPAFAYVPSVRAIVEAVPVAHWLLDPTVTAESRIKRSIVFRLKSANELGRMQHLAAAVTDSQMTRQRCIEFATHHGWLIANNAIGGESTPTAREDYSRIALGEARPDLDRSMWAIVSASHHSTFYSLVASLKHGITITTPFDQRGGVAPVVVDGQDIATHALMNWRGCVAVARARDELMGWTPGPEMDDSAEQIRRHGASVTNR